MSIRISKMENVLKVSKQTPVYIFPLGGIY